MWFFVLAWSPYKVFVIERNTSLDLFVADVGGVLPSSQVLGK